MDNADLKEKLAGMFGSLAKAATPQEVSRLDRAVAEICRDPASLAGIFGPQPDPAAGMEGMIQTARGQKPRRRDFSPDGGDSVGRLADAVAGGGFDETVKVLLNHVAERLGGPEKLSRTGLGGDVAAVTGIVGCLEEKSGLVGGPKMAAAVTSRVRTFWCGGGGNPSLDTNKESDVRTMDAVLGALDTRATQLGYLLDLANTELGDANPDQVDTDEDTLGDA